MNKYLPGLPAAVFAACLSTSAFPADHADGPLISGSARSADIGDVFMFLDPNDNTRLVIAMTTQGFIVPAEAVNFSVFDPFLNYRFELETTGDAKSDSVINVKFSPKEIAGSNPQTATIRMPHGAGFTAPTTASNLSDMSPVPIVTTDPASGIDFFAGEVDDPFPFDIVGFGRFVASVLAGSPDPTQLQRGRDSFAGYNTLAIVLRVPVSLLGSVANNIVGVSATTVRRPGNGPRGRLDRAGIPAVNVALVPFDRKDEYNQATTSSDANGRFADSIVGTLTALGTSPDNINLLAGLAVVNGDFLRTNLGVPNTGPGGGDNPEAAFPNGRRLGDDVIDTVIAVVTNGAITTGDNTVAEQAVGDEFPFFPPTHQPFIPGTLDDRTRN
jgi:hypothetical protein